MEEFEAIISGRVQLVMYRDFAQRKARSLGLSGTVQNQKDGTVRVVAQGPREKLEAFHTYLKKGPILAEVKDVAMTWRNPTTTFDGFSIIY